MIITKGAKFLQTGAGTYAKASDRWQTAFVRKREVIDWNAAAADRTPEANAFR
ncbi:MAG: hypothetical protein WKF92_07790 [Pyrinomonadaceae bacterium]